MAGLCFPFSCSIKKRMLVHAVSSAAAPDAVCIIHLNGELQELRGPVRAIQILSQNPNCILCSSETLEVNRQPRQVPNEEQLVQGPVLYFLLPLSISRSIITLEDLCSLAVKANTALQNRELS